MFAPPDGCWLLSALKNTSQDRSEAGGIVTAMNNRFPFDPEQPRPFIIDESARASNESTYWSAVRTLNQSSAEYDHAAAIGALIGLATNQKGSVGKWARESLLQKIGLTILPAA